MAHIVDFGDFTLIPNGNNAELHCWLCQKAVSHRALFCHHCGTIQPVRELDHFARLGLEHRIDIENDHLDRQYEALRRTLDPSRFMIRGMGERGHAAKQLEALIEAYETLRDPLRRGRYWLTLHQKDFQAAVEHNPFVQELRQELQVAENAAHYDRIANRAGQAIEDGIMGLLQALRSQQWQEASAALIQLDGLEGVLKDVRTRRAGCSSLPHLPHQPMGLVEAK